VTSRETCRTIYIHESLELRIDHTMLP